MANRKNNNVIYPGDGTALIELTQRMIAIVDEDDAPWLINTAFWYATKCPPKNYSQSKSRETNKNVYMHRLIASAPNGFLVDHVNGNGLDNRRSNLRICSPSQNSQNSRIRSDNRSGFKGVRWDKSKNKWRSQIRVRRKLIHIGYFTTAEEAFEDLAAARIKLHGEFANHGQYTNQHLVTSHSVHTTYSPPIQENMCDQDQ